MSGLKIDIEGAEYDILENLKEYLPKLNFLILEFHDINNRQKEIFKFVRYCSLSMNIAHLHINNSTSHICETPKVVELTFVRKDENKRGKISFLPNKNLDYPNNHINKDFCIIF